MVKSVIVVAFLAMILMSLADAKSAFVEKAKGAFTKVGKKIKEIAGKSEYMCPLVSSFCEQHCARLKKSGDCDLLKCKCT
uniref:Putative Potassium channel toxin n=1 Tax=Megacormus gertschi TaxID=1843536 RepID=A0A224XGQ4_9SCOR